MNMPGMDGIQFLRQVKVIAKDTVRMMLTGLSDMQVAIEAVNEGSIFRLLTKPCATAVLAKALPATGIMAIGGWPKGLFTHQIRQFRVISAATQKCCSREMDD
jgi:response regulator RpfG family c-di-GMP phosphodiesterase